MKKLFDITINHVRISDPCYDKSSWGCINIPNCKIGKWVAEIEKEGNRVSVLKAMLFDHDEHSLKWKKFKEKISVDSGQAGIYDDRYYKDDKIIPDNFSFEYNFNGKKENLSAKNWYGLNCCKTLDDNGWGIIPFGCVSSTGYGDGDYPVYYQIDEDLQEMVALKIVYIFSS